MEQRVCLNLASLKHLDYESALTASAKAGFRAVGLQEVQVERYLASGHTLAKARLFLDSLGLAAPEMNFFPGWIYARGEARIAAFRRFAHFCELATALGQRIIIVTTSDEGTPDDACWPMKTTPNSAAWPGSKDWWRHWNAFPGRG